MAIVGEVSIAQLQGERSQAVTTAPPSHTTSVATCSLLAQLDLAEVQYNTLQQTYVVCKEDYNIGPLVSDTVSEPAGAQESYKKSYKFHLV